MKIDIGIPEAERLAVADGLKKLLADTYTLYLKTHGYHWNVTGPMFHTLHEMFMIQYTELWNAVDLIAERIRSVGVMAPAGYDEFAKLTEIQPDKGVPEATEMLRQLVTGHETVIKTCRSLLPIAEKAGDEVTLDVVTQRLTIHEKTAWMLRSLLG
ncbi:MAG: DNA starvation/stationary phase protection protein [bacterium]|nr:DNA starvation/stationary phase protection protein [bacterium]